MISPTATPPAGRIGLLLPEAERQFGLLIRARLQWWIAPERLMLLSGEAVAAGEWPETPAAVVLPDVTPTLGPALLRLLGTDVPLICCRDTETARRLLGAGAVWVNDPEDGAELAAAIQRVLKDSELRETLLRKGRAQARRLLRLLDVSSDPSEPLPASTLPPQPAVSVVIPTAGGDPVQRCVASLRLAAGDLPLQVILAVTGEAGALPMCDTLVASEPPLGRVKATNAGVQAATAPWVLLLQEDACFTTPGDLLRLLEVADQWPYLAALGPVGPGISAAFQQYALGPIMGGIFIPTDRPLSNHCLLVRRECFDAVGPFDPACTTDGEAGLDWLYRARMLGYRWGIHEGVFVAHPETAATGPAGPVAGEQLERKNCEHLDPAQFWTTTEPEVSWVITSHEGARSLAPCLDSLRVCSQGLDYEIVMAVDGSDPGPYAELLRHYPDLPLRTAFFRPAGSPGEARNRALRLARGRVLFPFTDHDVALPAHQTLLEALGAADVAFGELRVPGDTKEGVKPPLELSTLESLLAPPGATAFPAQCAALRRELADRFYFREELPSGEEYELWLRLARDGLRLRHVGQPVTISFSQPGLVHPSAEEQAASADLQAEYARYLPLGAAPERPVYSYVITAWNEAERLARCLESLLACAPPEPYEVLLADDGSTDATLAVAATFLHRLPLRIHPFPKAPTVAVAYNRALRLVRGQYVLLMDADDETTPERIPGLRAVLDQSGADFVYGSFTRITPQGPEPYEVPDWEVARLADLAPISPCAALFHRRILDAGPWLREELPAGEDRIWLLDLDRAGFQIVAAPHVVGHWYYMRPGSIIRRFPVDAIERRYSPRCTPRRAAWPVPASPREMTRPTLDWVPFPDARWELAGLPWFAETTPVLARLPDRLRNLVPGPPLHTLLAPSGARLRFRSDSGTLGLRLHYEQLQHFHNLSGVGQMGVDLYVGGEYWGSVAPKGAGVLEVELFFGLPRQPRELCLYLPLYHAVELQGVGLEQGATLEPPAPFGAPAPVVFYGSSITQGGCASRSGLSYPAVVSRMLDRDFVNLGFTGLAYGQPEMAAALAEIDAAAYVLDFAQNLPTPGALASAYEPFLDTLRAARPHVPILCLSPFFVAAERYDPETQGRLAGMREVTRECVRRRGSQDRQLWEVDGWDLLGPADGECLTDGVHPGDHGFHRIARRLRPTLERALRTTTGGGRDV